MFVLIMGWMTTLNYLSVIAQPIADLIVMVKRIFARDFFTFIIVYIFFYIGLAFALPILQFLQRTTASNPDEPFVILFSIENIVNAYENDDNGSNIVMVIITVYCFISFLVLSNLLIAMVNQSYSVINELGIQQKQYFRLRLLRNSFWFSSLKSKLLKFCCACRNSNRQNYYEKLTKTFKIYKNCDDGRYYMELERDQALKTTNPGTKKQFCVWGRELRKSNTI